MMVRVFTISCPPSIISELAVPVNRNGPFAAKFRCVLSYPGNIPPPCSDEQGPLPFGKGSQSSTQPPCLSLWERWTPAGRTERAAVGQSKYRREPPLSLRDISPNRGISPKGRTSWLCENCEQGACFPPSLLVPPFGGMLSGAKQRGLMTAQSSPPFTQPSPACESGLRHLL